jgi:hypothetical protein
MPRPKNAMEVFRLLDKSNCRKCGEKTCLAFAGSVFMGQKSPGACPKLDPETIARLSEDPGGQQTVEQNRDEYLDTLKREVSGIDLGAAAERVDALFSADRLTLKVLGKDFSVDGEGRLYTDIHINPWIAVPFLHHVLYGEGLPVSGDWVSFRELNDGKERYPLFQKRCEWPMKRVADTYTDLFDDMVHIFNGKQVEKEFESDISVVLYPLPNVPVMVCYWSPEEGLASTLNLFFDKTAERNLDNGSIFTLGAGLAQMFEKLALRHGFAEVRSSP